uniref:ERCC4 domain-containing protein n=1 Tax=viral metagenome TaxID=1070528 RepID=A0A6C0HST8_9ZZZZ
MRLIIDKRETALFQKCSEEISRLPEETTKKIIVLQQDLPIGDIIIQKDDETTLIIIERKSFSDLLSSIKDGRYEEQSHRLLNTSELPPHSIIYLLEGMFSNLKNPKDKNLIYSCITSLNFFKGFSIMRTSTIYETAEWLILLVLKITKELEKRREPYFLSSPYLRNFTQNIQPTKEEEEENKEGNQEKNNTIIETTEKYCNFVKKVKKENITPENIGEIILSQIPGISSITAIAIMKNFSTFPKFMAELEKNPECMNDIKLETNGKFRKISKSSIENIIKYLSQGNQGSP